jgi:RimJ/RimL family protein N-acetyltransferase
MELRTASREICAISPEDGTALAGALGVKVAMGWPPEHHDADALNWLAGKLDAGVPAEWLMYFAVLQPGEGRPAPLVIGLVGYKGPPDERGAVEVGYSILPAFQRRGYASEAVGALIARAFADPRVTRVGAETYPELAPSLRVMEKCGLVFTGPGSEPRVVRYDLTRVDWEARRR